MKNENLVSLIQNLMKTKKPIWRRVARELSKPRRRRIEVNLSKIEQYAAADSTVLIPGKVLGTGNLSKKVTVAAYSFSESAKKLIGQSGGKAVSIESLHKSNPEGKDITLLS